MFLPRFRRFPTDYQGFNVILTDTFSKKKNGLYFSQTSPFYSTKKNKIIFLTTN